MSQTIAILPLPTSEWQVRKLRDFHQHARWRDLGYTSFSACVVAEMHWSEAHVSRVLKAAETIAILQDLPAGKSLPLPTSEWQVPELAPLRGKLSDSRDAWRQTAETTPATPVRIVMKLKGNLASQSDQSALQPTRDKCRYPAFDYPVKRVRRTPATPCGAD